MAPSVFIAVTVMSMPVNPPLAVSRKFVDGVVDPLTWSLQQVRVAAVTRCLFHVHQLDNRVVRFSGTKIGMRKDS